MPETGFYELYQQALQEASGIALWRMPGQHQAELRVQFSPLSAQEPAEAEVFVFHPFVETDSYKPYWIKAEASAHIPDADLPDLALENDRFERAEKFPPGLPGQSYVDYVKRSVQAIQQGALQKTVAAGTAILPLAAGFSGIRFFRLLCQQYPGAFISMVRIQGQGSWIGASPELLLSREHDLLRTMALAGTRSIDQAESWTFKEREEQGFVRKFIEDIFRNHGLQAEVKPMQEMPNSSPLLHLVNEINTPLPPGFAAERVQALLNELHPTPAVAGMPQQDAMAWILQNEKADRAYYSGYLGPRLANGDFSYFVNLRCMQWQYAGSACLYAGAGITDASVAEKEWDEINKKMQVLSRVLLSAQFSQ